MKKTFMLMGLLFPFLVINAQVYVGDLPGFGLVVEKSFTTSGKPLMMFQYGHRGDSLNNWNPYYDSLVLYSDNLQRYRILDYPTVTENRIRYTMRGEEIVDGSTEGSEHVIPCLRFGYVNIDDGAVSYQEYHSPLTQTLFNDDSKFEYVLPHFDGTIFSCEYSSRDYYSGDTIVYRKYNSAAIGFDVFNEDGDVVATIRVGEDEFVEDYDDNHPPMIVKWGGNYFFVCCVSSDNWSYVNEYGETRWGSKYYFYRIDRQTQKIEPVASVPFSVRPTVMERGQEVVVELDEGSNAREIEVVNALGQTVKRVPVAAGQREVRFNSAELGSGMNFVSTRTSEGQGTVKIIVR